MLNAITSIFTFVEMELRRLRHDPIEVIARAVQPVLWVTVFGVVMAHRVAIGVQDYVSFITPGVVFQSATFMALAYGIMMVFERESGILKKAPLFTNSTYKHCHWEVTSRCSKSFNSIRYCACISSYCWS